MKYNSERTNVSNENITIKLNALKQLEINTSLGSIIEHKPLSFNNITNEKVNSHYIFKNNILSFHVDNYDNTQETTIDPWIISPNFSGSGAVWEVETDGFGNIYTTGGEVPMELKKYNSAGTLQWVYSTPFDTINGDWLGTLATDKQGNSYISQGTSPQLEKIDNTGNMIWHANGDTASNSYIEYWSITFNCDTTMLIIGGTKKGATPFDFQAAIFNADINNGNVVSNFG